MNRWPGWDAVGRQRWWVPLVHWPLMLAAGAFVGAGVTLLVRSDPTSRVVAGMVLIVLGSVTIGAWVFSLGSGGHQGVDDD